jgi:preprotein translocase subunit SecD
MATMNGQQMSVIVDYQGNVTPAPGAASGVAPADPAMPADPATPVDPAAPADPATPTEGSTP